MLEIEEGSVCEVIVDGRQLDHVSEFVLHESGADGVQCCRNWRVGEVSRV